MSSWIERTWAPASKALSTAGGDVARGAALVGRGTLGLTGALALVVAIAFVGSEQVREQAHSIALSAGLPGIAEATPALAEPRPDADTGPTSFSGWLAARPQRAAEPAQENVTRYLSRRYRVAENVVRQIVVEAFSTGRSIGLDPLLILAVSAIESNLNPFAQSPVGAQGLMQVMTHVHSDKFAEHGGDLAALDPIANLKVGSGILKELIRRGGSIERGLQLYVGAGNAADDGGYAVRVLGEMSRIKLASAGEVREALAASLGAAAAATGRSGSADVVPVSAQEPAGAPGAGLRDI